MTNRYDTIVNVFEEEFREKFSKYILRSGSSKKKLRKFFFDIAILGPNTMKILVSVIEKDFPEHKKLLDKILVLI